MNTNRKEITTSDSKHIKVAFFDMDGTLIQGTHKVSEKVRDSIFALRELGIKTCLATGRPYFGAKEIAKYLGISEPSMFYSGALIVSPGEDTPLLAEYLSTEDSKALYQELKAGGFYTEIYVGDDYFVERRNDLSRLHAEYLRREPTETNLEELSGNNEILKYIAMVRIGDEERRVRELLSKYPNIEVGYGYGDSNPDLLFANIHSKKASRDGAFDFFLRHYGILPSETITFGDSESDVPFFKRSGISVAMGNSIDRVKSAASYVTSRVEEDGVPNAISKIFGV